MARSAHLRKALIEIETSERGGVSSAMLGALFGCFILRLSHEDLRTERYFIPKRVASCPYLGGCGHAFLARLLIRDSVRPLWYGMHQVFKQFSPMFGGIGRNGHSKVADILEADSYAGPGAAVHKAQP
jgi:hypothetical protein